MWPSFMEMALHLEVFCPSALPPGVSESSRATVNDDQTSCRGGQGGNRVSMKGTAGLCQWRVPRGDHGQRQQQQIVSALGKQREPGKMWLNNSAFWQVLGQKGVKALTFIHSIPFCMIFCLFYTKMYFSLIFQLEG